MKRYVERVMLALVAGLFIQASPVMAASSEAFDLDPNLAAKVAREKMKASNQAMRERAAGGDGGSSDSSKCGQVDIGNDNGPKTASQRLNQRDKTIVIAGPVINAARCR